MSERPYLLFATRAYQGLADRVASWPRTECARRIYRGRVVYEPFPDGELGQAIVDDVRGRDCIVLGGTIDDKNTMEMFDLASGLVDQGARSLQMVFPYFGCSTMEREGKRESLSEPRKVVSGKSRMRLFSRGVPMAPCGNSMIQLDLHSDAIQTAVEGLPLPTHLYCEDINLEAVRRIMQSVPHKRFTLLAPDGSRVPWVRSLARRLELPMAIVLKERKTGSSTSSLGFYGRVRGRHVVLFDDMLRTCGTALGAIKAAKAAGASGASIVATFGILPGNSLERLRRSRFVHQVYCTDAHVNAVALAAKYPKFLKIQTVAGTIREAIPNL